MSLEFIARNGIISRGNIIVTGSLTASGSLALTNIGSSVFSGSITQIASTASFGGLVNIGTTASRFNLTIPDNGRIGSDYALDSYIQLGNAIGLVANYNVYTLRNLAVGAGDISARLGVKGSGTTSSTTSFLVQNSAGSTNAQIYDDGQWFIGTGNIRVTGQPGNFKFDTAAGNIANIGHYGINFQPLFYNTSVSISNIITISGSVYASGSQNINGDLTVSGSLSVVGTGSFTTPNGTITIQDRTDGINGTAPTISSTSTMRLGTTSTTLWVAGSTVLIGNSGNQLGITGDTITPNYDNSGALGTTAKYWGNAYINQLLVRTSARITGSLAISGSASTSSAALTVYKSGSTVLDVQGSQGSLMSIEDSLTGSLMSVGNISGLPLMEVFDDGTMNAGKFNVYPIRIVATGSQAIITGSLTGSFSGNIIATTFTASSALVTGNVTVLGTASINNLIINQIGYSSGSNQLGDAADDTQTFYGTVVIPTGSLTVSGSTRITGSLTQIGSSSFSGGSAFSGGTYLFNVAGAGDGGLRIDNTINGYNSLNWLSNTVGLGLMAGGGLFAKVSNNAGFHIGQSQNSTFVAALSVTGHGTTTSPTFVVRNSAGTNILRVVDSGLVGINTAAPSASLHISGASSAVLLEIDSPTTNNILFVSGSGNVGIGTNTPARTLEVFKSGLVDGSVEGVRITVNHSSATAQAALEFYHQAGPSPNSRIATDIGNGGLFPSMYFYHNGSNRITITSGGNVLIGTSTNSARLTVQGSGATSSTTAFLVQNSNTSSSLAVLDSGNVGIGTSAPSASLQIGDGTTGARTLYIGGAVNSDQIIGFNVNNTVYHRILSNANTGELRLEPGAAGGGHYLTVRVNGTEQMRVRSTGVGIGTTTPLANLHVVGNTILSGSAGSGSALTVYKSGSTVLDVQGSSGQLFSVTDSLTGSLFSVNTVAGLPTIEAFSDNTVNIGKFNTYPIKVVATGSLANITGSFSGSLVGSVTGTATSASFALTASYVNPLTQSVSISGSLTNIGSFSSTNGNTLLTIGAGTNVQLAGAVGGTLTYAYAEYQNAYYYAGFVGSSNVGMRTTGTNTRVLFGTDDTGNGLVIYNNRTGLGTVTPTAKLHIKGEGATSSTTALRVENANASSSLTVLDNGNVGIGYSSPSYLLDVSGSARISGVTYIGNDGAGSAALYTGGNVLLLAGNNNHDVQMPGVYVARSGAGFGVGIEAATYASLNNSAILTLTSTTRGLLLPRTHTTSNISSPARGLMTYVTSSATEGLYYYNSGSYQGWTKVLNDSGSQVISGSLALTGALTASSAVINGNVTVLGTASIAFLNVTYESASVIYSSGSNQLGDAVDDTQLLYGSVIIPTGSLVVTGSVNITGSAGAITVGRATSTAGLVHIQKPANSTLANLYLATPYPSTTPTSIIFQNNDFGGGATGTGSINWDVGGTYFNISNRVLLGAGQTSIDLTPGSTIGLSRVGAGDLQLNFLQGGVASYVIRNVSGQRALAFITDGVTTTTAEAARFTANSNFLVGTTSDVARVAVKGSGTTSSTTSFLVQNANASASFQIKDNSEIVFATPDYTPNDGGNPFAYLSKTRTGIYVANTTSNYGISYESGQIYANIGYSTSNPTFTPSSGVWTTNSRINAPSLRGTNGIFTSGIDKFVAPEGGTDLNLIFGGSTTSSGQGRIIAYGETHNPKQGKLELYSGTNPVYGVISFLPGNTEAARFTPDGNFNIGAITGSTKLNVSGSSNFTGITTITGSVIISGSATTGEGGYNTVPSTLYVKNSIAVFTDLDNTASINLKGSSTNRGMKGIYFYHNNRSAWIESVPAGFGDLGGLRFGAGGNTVLNFGTLGTGAAFSVPVTATSYGGIDNNTGTHYYNFNSSEFAVRIASTRLGSSGRGDLKFQLKVAGGDAADSDTFFYVPGTNKNISINSATTDLGAQLGVKGSGATSSTTGLLVQNSNGSSSLQVLDNGNVGIGGVAMAASYKLRVYGSIWADSFDQLSALNGNAGVGKIQYYDDGATLLMRVYGPHSSEAVKGILTLDRQDLEYTTLANSITHTASFFMDHPSFVIRSNNTSANSFFLQNYMYASGALFVTNQPAGGDTSFRFRPSASLVGSTDVFVINTSGAQVTGNLSVTSPASTGSALYAYKSGSTVLDIQGSQGQLFSVIDALSGSLMSVNDISGLPIVEVFSDDRVVMGTYGSAALTVTGSAVAVATGSSAPTGTAQEGTFRFAVVGGSYYIYAYIGGAWRSGSLS